jgi:hypothetical protein
VRRVFVVALLPLIPVACSAEKKTFYQVSVAYGHGLPGSNDSAIIIPDAPVRIPKIVHACGVALDDVKDEFATDGMMDVRFSLSGTEEGRVLPCLRKNLPKGTTLEKAFYQ